MYALPSPGHRHQKQVPEQCLLTFRIHNHIRDIIIRELAQKSGKIIGRIPTNNQTVQFQPAQWGDMVEDIFNFRFGCPMLVIVI